MPTPQLLALAAFAGSAAPALAAQSPFRFVDRTEAAGLQAWHGCAESAQGLCAMAAGGAAEDFDGDGWPDLFLLGGGARPDRLYINRGDGTFAERSAAFGVAARHLGVGVACGDYDGDGWMDLFVTSLGAPGSVGPGQHLLYRNRGGTGFQEVAASAGVALTTSVRADGFGAAFGDYDLDGDLDLCVASWRALPSAPSLGNRLFRNEGDGTFVDVTGAALSVPDLTWGFTPIFADMDGDFYPELLLAADFGSSRYFANDGLGGFVDRTEGAGLGLDNNGMGAVVADLNADGRPDWFVTSVWEPERTHVQVGDGNKLYLAQGEHRFEEVAAGAGAARGGWGWGAAAFDGDHDGRTDLFQLYGFSAVGAPQGSLAFQGTGAGRFRNATLGSGFHVPGDPRALMTLDFDRDGDLDLCVTTHGGRARLYENRAEAGPGRWLIVELDTRGRPDLAPRGLGSRIRVSGNGRTFERWMVGGGGYLSASECLAHFGLGAASGPWTVEVFWCDGGRSELQGVADGQRLRVRRE